MISGEQREQLLRQVVLGVELDIARDMLGISALDLQMDLVCDEAFDISLALAQGMRTEFAAALYRSLLSD
jgi:hypothetical protein